MRSMRVRLTSSFTFSNWGSLDRVKDGADQQYQADDDVEGEEDRYLHERKLVQPQPCCCGDRCCRAETEPESRTPDILSAVSTNYWAFCEI